MLDLAVFVVCRRAAPEGPHGPGALARLPYTLEGVSYTFTIDDPAAEPPFSFDEVWLYLRFVRTAGQGFRRRFALRVARLNDDGTRTPVAYPPGSRPGKRFVFATITFPTASPVISVPIKVRNLLVPSRGQYEFQLLVERTKPTWNGSRWRRVGTHLILVE